MEQPHLPPECPDIVGIQVVYLDPTSGAQEVKIHVNVYGPKPEVYEWDFGDGVTLSSTDGLARHSYALPNENESRNYTINVSLIGPSDCQTAISTEVVIEGQPKPASSLGNSVKGFFFGTPLRIATTISSAVALISYFFSASLISPRDPIPVPPDRVAELVRGKIAHYVPDTMTVDLDTQVWVHVSKALNDSILLQGRSVIGVVTDTMLVSSSVSVSLIDPSPDIDKNFHISNLSPDRQSVDDSTSTIWEWNVRPLKAGTFPLRISAEVDVINEFGRLPKYVPVYDDEVFVEAIPFRDTKNFFQKYWQWLITVIVIPLLSLAGKKIIQVRKKRREKREKERKEADDRGKIAGMS